jgi:heme/copper-type cytochrome/quinol oxidase subunit 4
MSANNRRLLIAAWFIGVGSSLVMGYFEYFAFTDDLDMSHTSLIGYPGYCLAMIITTILAFMYARRAQGKNWNVATILLTIWVIISVLSTVLVKNSTSG